MSKNVDMLKCVKQMLEMTKICRFQMEIDAEKMIKNENKIT